MLKDKRVRNGFEHIDTRIDTYLAANDIIWVRTIGTPSQFLVNGEEPKFLQFIDPSTHTVSILDRSINLNSLNAEVQEIYYHAINWMEEHNRPVVY